METPSVEFTVVWYTANGIQGGSFGPFTSRRNAENCVAQLAARNEVKRAEIKES